MQIDCMHARFDRLHCNCCTIYVKSPVVDWGFCGAEQDMHVCMDEMLRYSSHNDEKFDETKEKATLWLILNCDSVKATLLKLST